MYYRPTAIYRQIIFLLFIPLSVLGGNPPADTLILLNETEITSPRYRTFSAGHSILKADSITLARYSQEGLDHLLSRQTGIFIKNYGPGILATSSLRGGSAGQTALVWNGFNLQSPATGQTDLALIPVFFTDNAGVQYGGGSALWGSGGMGGAIHLNNNRPPGKRSFARAQFSASDMGEAAQYLDLFGGRPNIASRLRVFHKNSDNNYRYKNTHIHDEPTLTQQHAALQQYGLLLETYFSPRTRHQGALRWWWQQNNRHIPPAVMATHTGAYQEDNTLRITGQWQFHLDRSSFTWRGAFFNEGLLYRDSLNQASRSFSQTVVQEAEVLFSLSPGITANSGVKTEWVRAEADSYINHKQDQLRSIFGSLRWELISNQLQLLASGRQSFTSDHRAPFAPSFGVSWQPTSSILVKANAGRNYRLPTMNDKYWIPGGNPDLKPEHGWSQDLGISFFNHPGISHSLFPDQNKQPIFRIRELSLNVFHRRVNEWIIWLPKYGSMFWSPQNLMEVQSYGLEARISGEVSLQEVSASWQGRWDYTIAKNSRTQGPGDASAGKQLIYVPKNSLGYNLDIGYKAFTLHFDHQFTGRRYTAKDHSAWLKAYHTGDLTLRWQTSVSSHRLSVFTTVSNLWNTTYEVMSGRPMPLRHARAGVSLLIQRERRNKQNNS
ncbi:MAG: TonB-dependent receptor plug domain-containing protein [Bacteroidales bacterium]